jgi:hypothetical protein
MKKLLLTLLLPLITFSSLSYGDELNSLFGITLNDNAEKYVSSNYIDSNKFKNTETIDGFFDLTITDKIKTKSPYASYYKITIDRDNVVHDIYGREILANLEICQEIAKNLVSQSEEKYQINFKYWEKTYPSFKKYSYYYSPSSLDFGIQCRESHEDSSVKLQIYLNTATLSLAVNDFYNSGL